MKLVQMPRDLLHVDDADLDASGIDPDLLAAFRAYLPAPLGERGGLAILAPPTAGTRPLLMVLARRIGAAMRDANIRLRDCGGDVKTGKQQLCYLPGRLLGEAFAEPDIHSALLGESACFLQDLDGAWSDDARHPPLAPKALLALLDARIAAGRPTFLSADPDRLPSGLEAALRARLPLLDPLDRSILT